MKVSRKAPALVLSPHLDDAVLGCWSVVAGGEPVRVANVFDGVPVAGFVSMWDLITGAEESCARMHERLAEDREALARAGAEPLGLGLLDNAYRDPAGVAAPSRAELRERLERAVPEASRVLCPAGIGGHPDHVLVCELAIALAREGMPVTIWAELPYALKQGWPHWVTGAERDPYRNADAYWESHLHDVPCSRESLDWEVRRLSDPEADAKLEAMRAYRTQFPGLDAGHVGRISQRESHRHEVFWHVRLPGAEIAPQTARSRLRRAFSRG